MLDPGVTLQFLCYLNTPFEVIARWHKENNHRACSPLRCAYAGRSFTALDDPQFVPDAREFEPIWHETMSLFDDLSWLGRESLCAFIKYFTGKDIWPTVRNTNLQYIYEIAVDVQKANLITA